MEEQFLSIILEKTFLFSNIWFGKEGPLIMFLILHNQISKDDPKCCGCTWSPGNSWINDKLDQSWSSPGNLGSHEGPAQVKTHNSHPGEHGYCEEVSAVANNFTSRMGNEVGKVVDKKNIRCEEKDGANIANDNLAMEIIQFRYKAVHKEGDNEEDAANEATKSIE